MSGMKHKEGRLMSCMRRSDMYGVMSFPMVKLKGLLMPLMPIAGFGFPQKVFPRFLPDFGFAPHSQPYDGY